MHKGQRLEDKQSVPLISLAADPKTYTPQRYNALRQVMNANKFWEATQSPEVVASDMIHAAASDAAVGTIIATADMPTVGSFSTIAKIHFVLTAKDMTLTRAENILEGDAK